ncbi:MAG: hypothetical protein BWY95_01770 [Bacteroidetes bacterium ADurb.BinA104]|nr:MAG: hypothetical protein BWY95_01770 [Bacteroidetes bacterium ADurb.BinA104]
MLLYLESAAILFHANAHIDIQVLGLVGGLFVVLAVNVEFRVVGILYVCTLVLAVECGVNAVLNKIRIEVVNLPVLTGRVHHGTGLHLTVDHEERRNSGSFSHKRVVGAKSRRYMDYTGAVIGGDIVAANDTETGIGFGNCAVIGNCNRFYPREELFVVHPYQIGALILAHNPVRDDFIALLV